MKPLTMFKDLPLNYNELQGLKGIIKDLKERYPFIKKIILYGSKVRGDFLEDSDVDLMFITEGVITRSKKLQISDLIYNHELSNDIIISTVFVTERDFQDKSHPFLTRVRREGKLIWSRE